jgi:hypothetical protein
MSGKMPPSYFREYRRRRRAEGRPVQSGPQDRTREYAIRRENRRLVRVGLAPLSRDGLRAPRSAIDVAPLPLLLPDLQHGARVAFWEDELRLDLHQEARLAELEGRDPGAAIAAYRARETSWRAHMAPMLEEIAV